MSEATISDMRKKYDSVKDEYTALKEKAVSMKDDAMKKVHDSISDYNDIIDIIGTGDHITLVDGHAADDADVNAQSVKTTTTKAMDEEGAGKDEPTPEVKKPARKPARKASRKKASTTEPDTGPEPMDPNHIKFSDDNGVVVASDATGDAMPVDAAADEAHGDDSDGGDDTEEEYDFL